jgi:Tol biopolymer transport system component
MTAEDLWRMSRVGSPAPAPDGSFLIVPVTTYNMDENRGRSRLWRVPVNGEPRPLTGEEASSTEPALSPDGKRLLYGRCQGDEKPQIHLLSLEGGEPERLTEMPLGAMDPRWFPDGKRIAFISFLYADAPTPSGTKELMERRAKDPVKAHVTSDRIYRFWDRWLTGGEHPHLFVLGLATRTLTDLTPEGAGWFDFMDPTGHYDIAPDGSEIAFSANASRPPHYLLRWAVFTVPTSGSGPVRCLTPEGQPENVSDALRPRYSPDGRSIVYGAQRDPFFYADKVRLVRYDRALGTHTTLTEAWDRSAGTWEFWLTARSRSMRKIEGRFSLPSSGRRVHAAPPRDQGNPQGSRSANGRLYVTIQTLSAPAEVAASSRRKRPPDAHAVQRSRARRIVMGEVRG